MEEPITQQNTQHDIFNSQNPTLIRKAGMDIITGQDTAEKYAQYFQGNRILPIPELVEAVQPKTLSLIVTDMRTRRLAGLKKETFEELLKVAGIPARYFCRRSFATWDVLLPSQELATNLAGNSSITSKYYRLLPEYIGKRRIKVTVCNVPIQLSGGVLAAFLSDFGDVEDFSTIKSSSDTAHGDYSFTMCLNRGGFQAIPPHIRLRGPSDDGSVRGQKASMLAF